MSLLLLLWSRFKGYIAITAALIGSIIAFWFVAKREGKSEEKVKNAENKAARAEATAVAEIARQKSANEREVETVKNTNEVLHENAVLSDSVIADELRKNWSRD